MASTGNFASTPAPGAANAPLDTSLTSPASSGTVFTAGASGGKLERLVMQGQGTTTASIINIWRVESNGTTYHLVDQQQVTGASGSTTVLSWRAEKSFPDFVLAASETVRVTQTVTGNQVMCSGFGASF